MSKILAAMSENVIFLI